MTHMPQFIASDVVPQLQLQSRQHQPPAGARRVVRAVATVALAGLVALLAGCASEVVKQDFNMVWPEPPQTARIKFLRTVVDDTGLGKSTTAAQGLANFLTGETAGGNRIYEPMGLAVTADGNRLYVSDYSQLKIFGFDFEKKTLMNIGGGERPLAGPMGLALDAEENIYVAESAAQGVSVFDRNGAYLRFITDESMERPIGLAIDIPRGKLYVADSGRTESGEHSVKVFDLQGKMLGKIGKQIGNIDGSFLFPTYITVDAQGNLYVADSLNSRVQKFDPDGKFIRAFGSHGTSFGQFDKPKGVAVDTFGNLYVVDSSWSNVQIFNQQGEVLLFFGGRGTYPGLLQNPTALAIDKQNRIYVGDLLNRRVGVYQLVNTTADDPAIKAAEAAEAAKALEDAKSEPAKK